MSHILNIFSIILFLLCWFLIIKKFFFRKFAPVKTVIAEVIDKYKVEEISKHPGVSKEEKFIVVFQTKDKKLSFYVSAFSYQHYRKKRGTLKYKGNQIISFR